MGKVKPELPPDIAQWGAQRKMNALETVMWRAEADPRFRSTLMLVELFDRAPEWKRFVASHEWGSRMVPRFRKRVIEPALGVGAPSWAVDPDFDISHHLTRVKLKRPGSLAQVLKLAQRMAMEPFDRERSPWQAMLVEGLADGQAGYLLKMHHVISDGLGAMQLLGRMHSRSRKPDAGKPQPPAPSPEELTPVTVLADEIRRRVSAAPSIVASWSEALWQGSRRVIGHPKESVVGVAKFSRTLARFLSPPAQSSRLLKGRSLSYRYLTHEVPLDQFKAAAKAADGSVNDAYLAGILGAFRLYHRRFRAPAKSLAMSIPISLRSAEDPLGGNRISAARFAGPLGETDPARRIRRIHELVARAREGAALDVVGAVAPVLMSLPTGALVRVFAEIARGNDVQASNVPGIPEPIFFAGSRVMRMFPFGPLPGCAAMFAMVSHNGICCIGVNVDPAAVTDVPAFAKCLRAGFDEVLALGGAAPTTLKAGAKPKARSRKSKES
jgi:WS/DGAT/MGAT family acyltransferase